MSSSNQKPNTKKRIVYAVLLAIPLCYNLFHLCFIGFQKEKLHAVSGTLIGMPRYHNLKGGYEWLFRIKGNSQIYRINYINPANINKEDIRRMKYGDSVTIYTYNDRSFVRYIHFLNGNQDVVGLTWNGERHLSYRNIADSLKETNLTSLFFWIFMCGIGYFQLFFYKPEVKKLYKDD